MIRLGSHLLAAAATVALASAAHAQDASGGQTSGPTSGLASATAPVQAGPGAASENGISDIVVTARRRAENIQSVPVSITAITADTLRSKSIQTPYDLVSSTPGITAQGGGTSRNDVIYYVRGQGATFGNAPAVVTYFAEVPQQAYSQGGGSNITFYDLESVQVLKGPQGTLFGRSTTGGAVLLTPRKPGNELDGFAELSIGNYSARELTAAVNLPIVDDRLSIRIAGNYSFRDGFTKSITTGEDLDDRNRSSYRISLFAKPVDWLTDTLIFQDNYIKENATSAVADHYYPKNSLLDTSPTGLGRAAVLGLCGFLTSVGQACDVASRLARIDKVRAGLDVEYARVQAGAKDARRKVATSADDFVRSHVEQFINTINIDFGYLGFLGDTSLKNIASATRNLHDEQIHEIQDSPNNSGVIPNDLGYNNGKYVTNGSGRSKWGDIWSEEVQLSGRVHDRHNWIVGFFHESTSRNRFNNYPAVFVLLDGALNVPEGLPTISSNFNRKYRLGQTGFFTQATLDLGDFGLDGVNLTGGYRRSIVKNSLIDVPAALTNDGIFAIPGAPETPAHLKQTANSYTFAVDWKVAPRVLLYATTRRGFKQGGINTQSVVPALTGNADARPYYDPETVTDYEVGAKTDWHLAGIAGRTDVALFHSKFSSLQRASSFLNNNALLNQIVNIAASRVNGVELENTLRLTDALEVDAAYSYLDSKFTKYPGFLIRPVDGAVLPLIDQKVVATPRNKFSLTGRYTIALPGKGDEVVAVANYNYQSRTYIADDGIYDPYPQKQKGYSLIDLRLDWNNVMGKPVDLSLFVRNLTDKLYKISSGAALSAFLGTATAVYGEPRMFGAQARVRFGASDNR